MARLRLSLALFVGAASPAIAQDSIPLRAVAPATERSTETVGLVRGLRHLPDGSVLVNDAIRRRLILFNPAMTSFTILADSAPGAANSYGRASSSILPYLGDSTIFVDFTGQSLLIFDEKGKMARVTAPPKPADLSALLSGTAGVDAKGRLVYRVSPRLSLQIVASNAPQTVPDSFALVRADFDTRAVDTIARLKRPTGSRSEPIGPAPTTPGGPPQARRQFINPLSWIDEWAMTSDGALALVRGRDYHVDWIKPDGSTASSPKMPYDWRRLTDDDKQRIADSTKRFYDSLPPPVMLRSTPGGATERIEMKVEYATVPLGEIPDYYPPVRSGGVLADRDGNIWILPYTSAQAKGKGIVYDVVNKNGVLVERVELPEGRSIAGFGRGGILYLMNPAPLANPTDRPGSAGFFLERTRVVGSTASTQ